MHYLSSVLININGLCSGCRFKEDKSVMVVSLPRIHCQELSVSLLPTPPPPPPPAASLGREAVAVLSNTPDTLPWQVQILGPFLRFS